MQGLRLTAPSPPPRLLPSLLLTLLCSAVHRRVVGAHAPELKVSACWGGGRGGESNGQGGEGLGGQQQCALLLKVGGRGGAVWGTGQQGGSEL